LQLRRVGQIADAQRHDASDVLSDGGRPRTAGGRRPAAGR
jgi:hypothetical protein